MRFLDCLYGTCFLSSICFSCVSWSSTQIVLIRCTVGSLQCISIHLYKLFVPFNCHHIQNVFFLCRNFWAHWAWNRTCKIALKIAPCQNSLARTWLRQHSRKSCWSGKLRDWCHKDWVISLQPNHLYICNLYLYDQYCIYVLYCPASQSRQCSQPVELWFW